MRTCQNSLDNNIHYEIGSFKSILTSQNSSSLLHPFYRRQVKLTIEFFQMVYYFASRHIVDRKEFTLEKGVLFIYKSIQCISMISLLLSENELLEETNKNKIKSKYFFSDVCCDFHTYFF